MKKATIIQHFCFWPVLSFYIYLSVLASTNVKLSFFGILLTAGIGTPIAIYFEKIRRYFANVRYRQGRLQRTGDGGEDCWSVIVKKYWIPFWKYPVWHFIRPFAAWEVTVDCGGYSPGSIRSGKRALGFIAQHEKFCVAVGHNDIVTPAATQRMEYLTGVANNAMIDVDCIGKEKFVKYQHNDNMTLDEYMTLDGLLILERDGLIF